MGARFLDDDARTAFKRAVESVENASAVEVVVAVRRRSASYLHANAIVGAVVAFGALATTLYAPHDFSLLSILLDPFLFGVGAAGVVELLPAAKRLLALPASRSLAVERAARATFIERGVHVTTGRSGLLVYVSWLEQDVALVADIGLARALPDGALATARATLAAAMPRGGVAVARALESLAPQLSAAMPHQADDVNELPDFVDSDMERR